MTEGKVYISALNKKAVSKKLLKGSTGSKHENSKGFIKMSQF